MRAGFRSPGPSARLLPISELAALLAARAPDLAPTLFPLGIREGHEFRVGSLAGEPGRSLAVHLSGARAGVWCDFASGEAGDALDLVAAVLFGGDKRQAVHWARNWLGVDHGAVAAVASARPTAAATADDATRKDDERRRNSAFSIWLDGQERIAGTPVDRYLRGRGIELARFGRPLRSLRFHPRLHCPETGTSLPAMIGAIVSPTGRFVAVHRTWLAVHADGRVTKAPLRNPKMTLGRYRGGCIRLWRGESDRPLGEAPRGETVIVTEGIEDALTVALVRPQLRVLCAVSLANMGAMRLPPAVRTIIVAADNDGATEAAARGLERALQNFAGAGHQVRLARPPVGYKDFNAMLADRPRDAG